jgi:predicted N-acyltransferase
MLGWRKQQSSLLFFVFFLLFSVYFSPLTCIDFDDPNYEQQWNFHASQPFGIQIEEAWEDKFNGSGVNVGIIVAQSFEVNRGCTLSQRRFSSLIVMFFIHIDINHYDPLISAIGDTMIFRDFEESGTAGSYKHIKCFSFTTHLMSSSHVTL